MVSACLGDANSQRPITLSPAAAPARLAPHTHAFFLDVDGTLVDFAERPESVQADTELLSLLETILRRSGGALALVSGRTIDSLDRITAPRRFAAAGVHGLERRGAAGAYSRHPLAGCAALAGARAALRELVRAHPPLLLEDKQLSLAVHFRAAPELTDRVTQRVRALGEVDADLKVQEGRMVVELLPRCACKAHALAAFMDEAPFKGRTPVYVGDDLTDEPAFEWINRAGGVSVAVAPPGASAACASLPSVAAVRRWLWDLVGAPSDG